VEHYGFTAALGCFSVGLAAAAATPPLCARHLRQGLTLVQLSAQPEPFLTHNTSETPLENTP